MPERIRGPLLEKDPAGESTMMNVPEGDARAELEFWKQRSRKYNELQWVNNRSYLDLIKKVGDFGPDDFALDVGTGTGKIVQEISPLVGEIVGIDISKDMLERGDWSGNRYCLRRDIRDPIFKEETFTRITARMVFHGILEGTQEAMNECYRVLKKGGKMVLAEGVPPSKDVKQDYIEIFKLKEPRLTFMEEDLVALMERARFRNVKVYTHFMREMSVSNWLEKSGLPEEIQDRIFEMHITAGDHFKKAYNMRIIRGDCLIDMKNAIVVGER